MSLLANCWICSEHVVNDNCMQNFSLETLKKETTQDTKGRIVLTGTLWEYFQKSELN